MRTWAVLCVVAWAALAAHAQDPSKADPCADCRKSAATEKAKCDSAASGGEALEACKKRNSEAVLACQLSACKAGVDPQMAGQCPECQHRAAEEDRNCRSMSPGSPDQQACAQRVGRMRAQCEEKFCKLAR